MARTTSTTSKAQANGTAAQAQPVSLKHDARDEAQALKAQAQAQEVQGHLSASDVAALAGVSAKDFRRWMRAQARGAGKGDTLPGKGGRYAYTAQEAEALAAAYARSKAFGGTRAPAQAILAALEASSTRA